MVKAHRLLSLNREDQPRLAALAPGFAVAAAATVVLASLSKALFLAANPIALLPWMFLGSAGITAIASLAYVAAMRRLSLGVRFSGLLLLGIASLVALRAAHPLDPARVSLAVLLWCPAVGHLILLQTWNLAASLLPTRQGKRLFPVLAAVTTLGAAVGGALVQLAGWIGAENLLLTAAALLVWPLATVRRVVRRLETRTPGQSDMPPPAEAQTDRDERSEVLAGLASIARRPLLADLALFVFLLQAASLLIDYQLSAELKPRFDQDEMASFLGAFYLLSNLLVLVLTLLVTSRLLRWLGIGVALAASGIVIGIGSGAYVVLSLVSSIPTFWVIAATAFGERVAQYAFTKPAMQMLFMPLQTSGGERAKTLIDGVIYRLATAVVSVLLLVVSPDLHNQFRLSPPAVLASLVLLYLGSRIGPHYRRAIFEALRARRIDVTVTRYLSGGLGAREVVEVERRLASGDPKQMLRALEIARELSLPVTMASLEALARHDDARIAKAALTTMEALGYPPSSELLASMLEPERPAPVLRAVLGMLSDQDGHALSEIVRPLTRHPDPGVASAACLIRVRAQGQALERALDQEVLTGERIEPGVPAARRVTGQTGASAFARELPGLLETAPVTVRHEVIELMAQMGLPSFVTPLIACLTESELRRRVMQALASYGDKALEGIADGLADEELALVARVSLLSVLEAIGSPKALSMLVAECRSREHALCDHAVEALWRMTAKDGAPSPGDAQVIELATGEIERLRTYAALEVLVGGRPTPRKLLFVDEVQSEALRAEQRTFRLLGMLYDRDAIQRAYQHYRARERQTRSNAIELLEQHIRAPELRAFVTLVERSEDKHGNMRPQSVVYQALTEKSSVEQLLAGDEPWLARLWAWVTERDAVSSALDPADLLDRIVVLKQLPMFRGLSGRGLLPMARVMFERPMRSGELLVEQGANDDRIYWLLEGEVDVRVDGRTVATVATRDCFGELAAIDGGPRSASVHALSDGKLLVLERAAFDDALDLNPPLIRSLLACLAQRLKNALTGQGAVAT